MDTRISCPEWRVVVEIEQEHVSKEPKHGVMYVVWSLLFLVIYAQLNPLIKTNLDKKQEKRYVNT